MIEVFQTGINSEECAQSTEPHNLIRMVSHAKKQNKNNAQAAHYSIHIRWQGTVSLS